MDDAQRRKQMTDKFWADDRAFQAYCQTVPEEWKPEADHLYQEGQALADIQNAIARYQDATEYPLLLTCWELGQIAGLLIGQSDLDAGERALLDKVYRLNEQIDARRKEAQTAAV